MEKTMANYDALSCDPGDYTVLPHTAGIYRDGGSLSCNLRDPQGHHYELVFPTMVNMACDVRHSLCFSLPQIFEEVCGSPLLVRRLDWQEALELFERIELPDANEKTFNSFNVMKDIAASHCMKLAA